MTESRMANYRDSVRSEAKPFFEQYHPEFLDDDGEYGAKSERANFVKWVDRTEKLNKVVSDAVSKWGLKEFQWVQSNTKNPSPAGGDPRSRCFGSYYSDILHELKKLKKKAHGV